MHIFPLFFSVINKLIIFILLGRLLYLNTHFLLQKSYIMVDMSANALTFHYFIIMHSSGRLTFDIFEYVILININVCKNGFNDHE